MVKSYFIILSFPLLFIQSLSAQEVYPDTSFKNTVRLNITPILVTGRSGSVTVGYERLVGSHQSFSANLGHLSLPSIITTKEGSPVEWINSKRNTGFIVSGDYRFYFNRNRYQAPDGLYWGPYVTYYYMDNLSSVELSKDDIIQGSADIQAYLNMVNVGVQLGYQFVFWDRWTLDLVLIGPGMGFYSGQMTLTPDFQISGDGEYLEGAYDALNSLLPGFGSLIKNKELSTNGKFQFRSLGYRMAVQVGFRF